MNNPLPRHQSDLRTMDIVNQGLSRRYRAEKRFRIYGIAAVIVSMAFLLFLFVSIGVNGYTAFQQTYVQLDIHLV